MKKLRIAIIGGGAAGLMAAARLSEISKKDLTEIILLERNKILGQKVLISGGGRCNLTNGLDDMKEILKKYPRGSSFLKHALHSFPPANLRKWFEAHGLPLKVEADLRVFPRSNKGSDVLQVFENIFKKSSVKVTRGMALQKIEKNAYQFILTMENNEKIEADKVILACGGQAYRHTGSRGDGYTFAESLGHSISRLGPSLNAFLLQENWLKNLAGLSFEDLGLTFTDISSKEKFYFRGAALITHKGITGPGVFALSAYAAYNVFSKENPAELRIDFLPNLSPDKLRAEIESSLQENPKKNFANILGNFLPKSLAFALCENLNIPHQKIASELSKKDFNRASDAIKNLKLTIQGRSAGDEFVTAGGIELNEINPKTMESKICEGLFFAGEILNYDGFTGGYNLQAAWSTGRLAGENALS